MEVSAGTQTQDILPSHIDKYRADYALKGYCHIKPLLAPEVAARLLADIAEDLHRVGIGKFLVKTTIHSSPGLEIYSYEYKLLNAFQWGVTPMMREITSVNLVPGFAYFQVYRKDNRLYVHSDRSSCEHSVSLTLGYSDGLPWDLTVGKEIVDHSIPDEGKKVSDDYGDADYNRVSTMPGEAVLYPGMMRRHGRLEPNPNRWSAHIFMHWVDADGPNAKYAFDQRQKNTSVDFNVPAV